MSGPLFDDRLRPLRRARALKRAERPFLAARIVEDLRERLQPVARRFARALVIHCPPALEAELAPVAQSVAFAPSIDALAGYEEGAFDLLLLVGELDWRDELPLLLRIAASRLEPGGLLAGAIPGGNSLPALRQALYAADSPDGRFVPRVHPRVEASGLAGLLADAGLAEPVVDVDRVRLRYRSLERLISDLRDHAATNRLIARPRQGLGRLGWLRAKEAFAALADGGATTETIELLFFAGWRPADNKGA
jgi:NADH dehydrogenase [ubiquinone] 1 alpha subcomplex assembly factor 5